MLLSKLRINGHSMEPILLNNDIILISNLFYLFKSPQVSDIVAFKFGNRIFIKRVRQIKNGKYLLQGDNIHDSLDSRKIGLVDKKNILGKVFLKLS